MNNKPSSHGGEHWVFLYQDSKKSPLIFGCSYGLGMESYSHNFNDFALRLRTRVLQNTIPLQSDDSNVCGMYALWFLWKLRNHYSLSSLYCNFSKNTIKNDQKVRQFVNKKLYLLNQCHVNSKNHVQCSNN